MDFFRKLAMNRELKRARALEGEGYVDKALAAYEETLGRAKGPARAQALRGVGACALRLGKLARSREALAESVRIAPGDPDAWHLLGRVNLELRDSMGAEEALQKALELAPERVDLLHSQSEYYATKFPAAALQAGKRTIAVLLEKPDEADRLRFPRELPLVFLRNLAAEQRLAEEVIPYFDELAKDASWIRPAALNHKGLLLANTGRLDEAVKAFLDVLTADPGFDAAHFNLGMSHARRRDFDAAKASFSVWAKKHPTDAVTTYGLGFAAETKPDVEEMIRLYSFFLERMKTNPPAPMSLGRLDIARGWVGHVETVLEHARKHKEGDHDDASKK